MLKNNNNKNNMLIYYFFIYYHGHNKDYIIIITCSVRRISSKFDCCRLSSVFYNKFVIRFICLRRLWPN